jgi:hypothetical protein
MIGNEMNPALTGFFAVNINFLINKNITTLKSPLKRGEMNQEATIFPVEISI